MELLELRAFLAVVNEGSFSRAAARLHRTQPAISQAVRRLENELGQTLFDRSSNPGSLTEAGKVMRDYADRLLRLAEEAETSVREIEDLRRGRVLIGTNDTGVPILLPLIAEFHAQYPNILVDVRRIHTRHIPVEVLHGNLDFGFITFHATEGRLRDISLGDDELVAIVHPSHPFAKRPKVTLAEWAREPIVVHNEPSPARERVMKMVDERHAVMNVRMAIPSLDGIKLAVEAGLGISLLPRRCVINELRRKQLAAVPIPELRLPRQMRLVYRRGPRLSQAATAFLKVAMKHDTDAVAKVARIGR
jgi:DNA-binding transcriptional LysR family regulator